MRPDKNQNNNLNKNNQNNNLNGNNNSNKKNILEELKKNAFRLKALIELYEKALYESAENHEKLNNAKTNDTTKTRDIANADKSRLDYLRREILKVTISNDKLIRASYAGS